MNNNQFTCRAHECRRVRVEMQQEIEALRQRVAELEKGITRRGDDVIVPYFLYQEMLECEDSIGAKLALAERDLLCFQMFTKSIMPLDEEWIGDVDGGTIQETAEACGLLQPVEVMEACGEGCKCADYGDFPQTCYRPTDTMKRAQDAAIASQGD